MKTILVSAYACNPSKGSEDGNGYNYAYHIQKSGNKVVCLTRCNGRNDIDRKQFNKDLIFEYLDLPLGLERLYFLSRPTMYLHYLLWQWLAYRRAKYLDKMYSFDLVHHVSWGSLQLGSFMYKLKIPFVFGPAGGGQIAPVAFKKYFKEYWDVEVKRELTSIWLAKINPGLKGMLLKAKHVIVSNKETQELALRLGAVNVPLILDVSLPNSFFPEKMPERETTDTLKLLWVGRLLPRKGILLITEVMELLKEYDDITLTIVGDGEMKEHLENDIISRKLSNVTYMGSVPYEKVKSFYANHDLFFFTSLRDSCPAQLFEAMAYGLPVITLKLHGQDAIINSKVGIKCEATIPEETVIELKNAIFELYHDRKKLKLMGHAAFNYAKQQTWDNQIDKIIRNYY